MAIASSAPAAAESSLPAAVQWIEGVLLGSVGTAIAVLAVGWIGLEMLTGRTTVRRGMRVLLGVFILFGAPVIASGFMSMARDGGSATVSIDPAPPPVMPQTLPPPPDPYAGASVPQ